MSNINIYMKEFIKAVKKLFKQKKGFTLIELLVVIGILGILAAALVATIDPFEQLNKAQDSNVKNTLVELVDANIRYYASQNNLPWLDNGASSACTTIAGSIEAGINASDAMPCIKQLVADSELKSSFTTVSNVLSKISIRGTATDITACFIPSSKSGRSASDVTWNQYATDTGSNCANQSSTGCYWCSR
jgi:prepilin-type N-terminal cleavage/methylation domain-containing protein